VEEKKFDDAPAEKRRLQRNEWSGVLLRIRNNAIIVLGIICLQLPFELAYAHLYEKTETEALRYVTVVYLQFIYNKIHSELPS
jgi:anoctamin-10